MKTAYYVRYWETKEDYVQWTADETFYFSNKKKAEKFIKKDCLNDNPVFAYELGWCDKIGAGEDCDYENHEPYEFYNSDEISKQGKML